MTLFQPILLVMLGGLLLVYVIKLRSQLLERVIVLAIGAVACLLVAIPELANRLANEVGIGRGADLIFYVSFTVIAFLMLAVFSKFRVLGNQLADVVRETAILTAKKPGEKEAS